VAANAHGGQRGQDERPQALLGALARRQGGARAGISTSPTLSFGGGGYSVVVVCCGGEYDLVKRGSVWLALIPIMYGRDRQGLPLISLPGQGCLLLACLGDRTTKARARACEPNAGGGIGSHLRPPSRKPCLGARPANHSRTIE
jgi:hypothetical protein